MTFSKTTQKLLRLSTLLAVSMAFVGCTREKAPLGSAENPIKMYFVPSVDVKVIEDNTETIKQYMEANTPYKYEVAIPASFVAVVEAIGTKRADVAAMNTFGYILANERYGAEAALTVIRYGYPTYQSQFITSVDSGINNLSDITGKKFAFVDPASTSGYLLPLKVLKDNAVEPSETVFAMRHDSVVSMIYQGQVDAGATFYTPTAEGKIQDARRLVKTQYPDVEEKIKIVELTDSIPNDPIVFRKDLPEEMKTAIKEAFIKLVKTPKGKEAFNKLYGVTDFKHAKDSDYDGVRAMLEAAGKSAAELAE